MHSSEEDLTDFSNDAAAEESSFTSVAMQPNQNNCNKTQTGGSYAEEGKIARMPPRNSAIKAMMNLIKTRSLSRVETKNTKGPRKSRREIAKTGSPTASVGFEDEKNRCETEPKKSRIDDTCGDYAVKETKKHAKHCSPLKSKRKGLRKGGRGYLIDGAEIGMMAKKGQRNGCQRGAKGSETHSTEKNADGCIAKSGQGEVTRTDQAKNADTVVPINVDEEDGKGADNAEGCKDINNGEICKDRDNAEISKGADNEENCKDTNNGEICKDGDHAENCKGADKAESCKDTENVCKVIEVFVCSECKSYFASQAEIDQHTCQGKTYICGACHCGFTRLCYLKRHRCGKKDESGEGVTVEAGEKKKLTEGLVAEDSGTRLSNNRHCKRDASGDKPLKCPICEKKYLKQSFLDKHLSAHHENENNEVMAPWKCPECDAKFRSAAKFQAHCKTQHGITRAFKCGKCDGYFSSKVVLNVHDRTHTNERPYSCSQCGKAFKQSSNLYDHLRKHNNDRPFICGTCGKAFNLKGDLTKHLKLHTGEKPYQCTFCPMAFPRVSNLNRHLNTHTGTKPFKCAQCDKAFSRREKLRDHERTHSGERPYSCDICHRTFADSGNFSNHKRFHKDPDFKYQTRKQKPPAEPNPATTRAVGENMLSGGKHQDTKQHENIVATNALEQQLPLINIDENRGTLSINVDSAITEAQASLQQQQQQHRIVYLTFPSPVFYVDKPDDCTQVNAHRTDANATDPEPLTLQLQNITDNPNEIRPVFNTASESPSKAQIVSTAVDSSPVNSNLDSLYDDQSLKGGDATTKQGIKDPATPVSLVDNLQQITGGSVNQLLSPDTGEQQLPGESNPATFFFIPGYDSTAEVSQSPGTKDQGTVSQVTSSNADKYLNLVSSSDSYFTPSLTLTDLTSSDYYSSPSDGQCGYVFIPQEGSEAESSKVNGILLATPTKQNSNGSVSKSALLCSQVLVTPEHAAVSKHQQERSSEEFDDDRPRFKPKFLKL
eukprot:gene18034-19840_t